MADDTQILTALQKLQDYYGKKTSTKQAQIYLKHLAELEPRTLEFAVDAWIRRSPFFPRLNELLQTASRYSPEPATPAFRLLQEQHLLERKFTFDGILQTQAWEDLAKRFDFLGLIYLADSCRRRYQNCKAQVALENEVETSQQDREMEALRPL